MAHLTTIGTECPVGTMTMAELAQCTAPYMSDLSSDCLSCITEHPGDPTECMSEGSLFGSNNTAGAPPDG